MHQPSSSLPPRQIGVRAALARCIQVTTRHAAVFILSAFALLLFGDLQAAEDELEWHTRSMPYAAFDRLPANRIEVGSAAVDVAFAPGELDLPKGKVVEWVATCAGTVAGYYGRFPAKRLRLLII